MSVNYIKYIIEYKDISDILDNNILVRRGNIGSI